MPDEPIHEEFGKPMAGGDKLSDEIFDERYGKYKETGAWNKNGSATNPSAQHDPKPFGNLK